jgi:hypothetical protein
MNINFKCEECKKRKVCKYTEIETPEIISKVSSKIDDEYCPEIIEFYVTCTEFERAFKTTRDGDIFDGKSYF